MVVYDSTLITPTTGLMIWTLVTFVVVLVVLKKYAFGPIQQMIDQRRVAITADLDSAEKVVRAKLDAGEQKRLIDDALAGVDFAALVPEGEQ